MGIIFTASRGSDLRQVKRSLALRIVSVSSLVSVRLFSDHFPIVTTELMLRVDGRRVSIPSETLQLSPYQDRLSRLSSSRPLVMVA